MQRLITCQSATLLLEEQADRPVAKEVRAGLLLHLQYCPYCNRYAEQTVLVADLARAAAAARETTGPALSELAKERMRQLLA
ncbi:MAG TPA: hypothetical protein VF629_13840 [Hymenobacter sp.]|jgi:hypothetical protein|uniref:hypothetical protein n=1 Tax=Hymenobacter sp. TaxID=1898978 RepID=UPI002ED86E00